MGAPSPGPRRIDHLVMPVASLDLARSFFEGLGFLVATDARHPFGTKNACVFFADGTYLEPLAVSDRDIYEASTRAGNVFVAHDRAYRFRHGPCGLSAMAFGSGDAVADHSAFVEAGLSDGALLQFSRVFESPDGAQRDVSFRLAFAADRRAPDLLIFAIEALQAAGDRSALTAHPNGVVGLRRIVVSEAEPSDFEPLLQEIVRPAEQSSGSFGLCIQCGNAAIDILTPDELRLRYRRERSADRGLRVEGVVLAVLDLSEFRHAPIVQNSSWVNDGGQIIVDCTDVCGSFIAFEQAV